MKAAFSHLEAEIKTFIVQCDHHYPADTARAPLADQRALYLDLCRSFAQPHPPGIVVEDHQIPAQGHRIPVRSYTPTAQGGHLNTAQQQPCILFLHGGSWMLGGLDSHDDIAAELAEKTAAKVLLVDYRLAPEHPYPAGLDDCYTVFRYLVDQAAALAIDPQRVALFGDSAGGNLAAALALLIRDCQDPTDPTPALTGQVLLYPALGLDFSLPSYTENAQAPLLSTADMQYYWRTYLNTSTTTFNDQQHSDAAPLHASRLNGLPATSIITAQYDPLRDDGERYAERLRSASVPVAYWQAPGLVHGFIRARHLSPTSNQAFEHACKTLREMLLTTQ